MKPRLLVIAALLSTLRATGANAPLTPSEAVTLKSVDALPTAAQIDAAVGTGPGGGLARLIELASGETNGSTSDLGIQIRATRLLPLYCTSGENCSGPQGTQVHDALLALVNAYVTPPASPAALSAQGVLRLRAAVEALGATQSGLDADVAVLTSAPSLLDHPSRDVRATVVRALRDLGSCQAVKPLQKRSPLESSDQVQQAILGALQSLHAVQMCS